MDIYIVYTNLLYSAILKPNSRIARFILNSDTFDVKLYAPRYLEVEIARYKELIQSLSGYNENDFLQVKSQLFTALRFIDDGAIPFDEWIHALRLVRDIDVDDVNFVALASFTGKLLWTGDKKLYEGLRAKGYQNVVMFNYLKEKHNLT